MRILISELQRGRVECHMFFACCHNQCLVANQFNGNKVATYEEGVWLGICLMLCVVFNLITVVFQGAEGGPLG